MYDCILYKVYQRISCLNFNNFLFAQLWDLDNILQGSGSSQGNEAGVVDSDDDEMDVDADSFKSNKGMVL